MLYLLQVGIKDIPTIILNMGHITIMDMDADVEDPDVVGHEGPGMANPWYQVKVFMF